MRAPTFRGIPSLRGQDEGELFVLYKHIQGQLFSTCLGLSYRFTCRDQLDMVEKNSNYMTKT